MARVLYVAKLAVYPDTGLPILGVRGTAGRIIKRGDTASTPTITEDQAGTIVITGGQLTITEHGFVPSFWVDEADMPVSWYDGTIEVPLETTEGLARRMDELDVEMDTLETELTDRMDTLETGISDLDALTDVTTTGATDGQVLTYDNTTGSWRPEAVPTGATTLDALTDVDTAGATTGQALVYDGDSWAPSTVSGGGSTITPFRSGSPLLYQSGRYIAGFDFQPQSFATFSMGAADQIILFPFEVRKDIDVTAIAAWVTGSSFSNIGLKLYLYNSSPTTGLATTNVIVSTKFTGSTTGGKEYTFASTALAAGLYWIGANTNTDPSLQGRNNTADHTRRVVDGITALVNPNVATAWPIGLVYGSQPLDNAAPNLSAVTPSGYYTGTIPIIYLKIA